MSNYLRLVDLANELDYLRSRDENEHSLDDEELAKLHELVSIEETLGDLRTYARESGGNLIPANEFTTYIQGETKETYDLRGVGGLQEYIDWKRLADDRKSDYIEVMYDGCTYLIEYR